MTIHHYSSRVKYAFSFCVVVLVFISSSVSAYAVNNLLFDSTTKTVQLGETLEIPINIHTDSGVNVIGADVWMTFDETYLDVQSLNQGPYFPSVTGQKTSTGKMYIAGMLEDTTTTKTGDGVIATVLFTPKKAGTTKIQFDCRGNSVSDTSKININFSNPQNVIDCASTSANIMTVTVSSTGGATANEPTPTVTLAGGDGTTTTTTYTSTDTTLSPAPSELPQSGYFDSSLYFILSGGFLIGVGGILQKLSSRPF